MSYHAYGAYGAVAFTPTWVGPVALGVGGLVLLLAVIE